MFSKAIALLLLAASAIAGPIAEGTYTITNVGSQSTARVDSAGNPIYVSSDKADPGTSEQVSPSLIIFLRIYYNHLIQISGFSKMRKTMVTPSRTYT